MVKPRTRLTANERLFVLYYTDTDPFAKTFGNGLQSYKKLHPNLSDVVCRVNASRMKARTRVRKAIRERIDAIGMCDTNLDIQLLKVVNQDGDLGPKVSAIKEANKVKDRYKAIEVKHSFDMDGLSAITKDLGESELK